MEAWFMLIICRLLRSFRTVAPTFCVLASCLAVTCHDRPAWAQAAGIAPAYTWDTIGAEFADPKALVTQRNAKDQVVYGRSSFSSNRPLLDG
jgi:hypothetical protein